MNKRIIFSGAIVFIAVLVAIMGYFLYTTQTADTPTTPIISQESQITIAGTVICLTPKNTRGNIDTSCAIGLAGNDGKNYALNADDPTLTGSVPTGETVRIAGTFIAQSSQYDSVGIIKVDSLERL